ncbi:DUF6932 family protein [Rhodopirellula halodulae]|uniref:DUF6932 family protein n=1 Tax=Rhodopirellula halodulae TaxID=2894198 RepID=UPI001E48E903|nr:hypothetical protein [Rhodopirellula sp. JC737]
MKPDHPALLEPGMHPFDLASIRERCVIAFGASSTRTDLMRGLEYACDRITAASIYGELWIDGSFVTQKENPSDIDALLVVPHDFLNSPSSEMQDVFRWLRDGDSKAEIGLDADVVPEFPKSSSMYPLWEENRLYWMQTFGTGHDEKTEKGIAKIKFFGAI